jgi:uncharacterized protein DUF6644
MSLAGFLQWLFQTGFSTTLRESKWAEPIFESVHVLTLTVFLGFSVLLDMRLLGVLLRRKRVSEVLTQLNPWLFAGFTVMIATGVLLFCGDPVAFYSTIFFRVKMIMLFLAGMNVLVFNWTVGRRVKEWDQDVSTPAGAKMAAILSLVLWAGIIAAGRGIAYVLPPP